MTDERLEQLSVSVERMRDQLSRMVSDAESEKDTRARVNAEILKLIKDQRDEFMNVLYGHDRKSGIVVDVDRLNNNMSTVQKVSWLLIGAVITIATFLVRDAITTSN